MSMYSEATSRADHVTTRLSLDANDLLDTFDKAEGALHTAHDVLFQLDRLVGFFGDQEAESLSEEIRSRIGSLAIRANEASQRPAHAIRWSAEQRIQHIAATTPMRQQVNPIEGNFEDCVD